MAMLSILSKLRFKNLSILLSFNFSIDQEYLAILNDEEDFDDLIKLKFRNVGFVYTDEDPSNDCMQDCAGIWGGDAVNDEYCKDLDGDGLGDYDTIEWFCSTSVPDDYVEDCSDEDDDCAAAMTDECGICDGPGPEFLCSDGFSYACNENECPDLTADYFEPAYLEFSDNPYLAMNIYVTTACIYFI